MSYKALYRTYRPNSFDTVVGQKHIVQTLQNALKHNKMSHAYLFCGPRGTGKTTVAKLVAKSVNCLNPEKAPCNACEHCLSIQNGTHPDVIEIDAASNNGVDEIRELIEKVKYAPLQAKYKVYIVDEVHMLSQGAFNALLKTLEEPPAHVIFILATTEPHKVLPTIISRCQRYDFVRVSIREIQERIEEVLVKEGIKFETEATRLISQLADGGVRDALSILEQCIAYSGKHLTAEHVNDIYGIATTQDKLKLLDAIIHRDVSNLMAEIELITRKNIDIRRLTNDLMELLKESVVYAYTKDAKLLSKLTEAEAKRLNQIPNSKGILMIEDLMDTAEKYRSASNLLSYFEIGLLKVMGHIAEDIPSITTLAKKSEINAKVREPEKATVTEQPKKTDEESEPDPIPAPSEPGQFTSEPQTELTKEDTVPTNKLSTHAIDQETIIEFFASGDKQMRLSIVNSWDKVKNAKNDLNLGRVATLLADAQVRALNRDFIVLTHADECTINEINSHDNHQMIIDFNQTVFGSPMQAFAISNQDYDEALGVYVALQKQNKLPKPRAPKKIEEVKPKETKEDAIQTGLFSLFGEENVEIL